MGKENSNSKEKNQNERLQRHSNPKNRTILRGNTQKLLVLKYDADARGTAIPEMTNNKNKATERR